MNNVEFKPWNKIPRGNPFYVTITEKIDGTNGCIVIKENKIVAVQSRKRFITIENDNYGFAGWVDRNKEQLISLGDGYHYGEWAGLGIQKNPLQLPEKQFFLFNTFRWNKENPDLPECCNVVPILFKGELEKNTITNILEEMKKDTITREGVVVYYHNLKAYSKHTIIAPNGKWYKT